MKKFLPLFILALASICWGQTTYNLPTTTVDYIPYVGSTMMRSPGIALANAAARLSVGPTYFGTYANLFANDIPLTIDGAPYYVNVTAHTDSAGKCISSCYVTFQDLTTGEEIPVPYTGSFSAIAFGKPTTLSGTFFGAFNGSFVLSIVPFQACGRYGCHTNYRQQNSTLTLN